jgi:hypothetical protein
MPRISKTRRSSRRQFIRPLKRIPTGNNLFWFKEEKNGLTSSYDDESQRPTQIIAFHIIISQNYLPPFPYTNGTKTFAKTFLGRAI